METSCAPVLAAILALLVGCPSPDHSDDSLPLDTGEAPAMEPLFSFVVLADPHLYGSVTHEENAVDAVEWVNENRVERGIELVVILGDVAWSAGLEGSPELLGALEVPWVPIIGDNSIQSDDEQQWAETFEPQFLLLAAELEGWFKADPLVENPEEGVDSWFQNLVFDYGGLRFLGLDFCTRHIGGVFGEMADLHDFEGGTLPWLRDRLEELEQPAAESVVMLSHHPVHLSPGAFDLEEMDQLEELLAPHGDTVAMSLAGHYHMDGYQELDELGYQVFVTDDVHASRALRVVRVSGNGLRFAYDHETVYLP